MFDIHVFKEFPNLFYDFAKEIYTYPSSENSQSKIKCSKTHKWIRKLETWNDEAQTSDGGKQELEQKAKGKLLRCYTQNIDTLEQTAGIQNVLYAHGKWILSL